MAKRAKKKAKKKKSKNKPKTRRKVKTAKRKVARKRTGATTRKRAPKRKKSRAPRHSEADMSWSEVRASRRKKGAGREDRIVRDFEKAVNMTPASIENWLNTSESKEVGTPRSTNA